MRDIKDYLEQTNTVLLTKDAFEHLKERASALDKIRAEIKQEREGYPPSADYYKAIMKVLQIIDKYKEERVKEIAEALSMIPVSVIEDIKAEIEHEGDMYPDGDWYISIDRVCEIFDKHTSRKEQE